MKIKASCPTCGDVMLPPESVTVVIYPRKVELNFYEFTCTTCLVVVAKTCPAGVIIQMRQAGSPYRMIDIPAEVLEGKPLLPAMTQDDILDFALDLEREDYLATLAQ